MNFEELTKKLIMSKCSVVLISTLLHLSSFESLGTDYEDFARTCSDNPPAGYTFSFNISPASEVHKAIKLCAYRSRLPVAITEKKDSGPL